MATASPPLPAAAGPADPPASSHAGRVPARAARPWLAGLAVWTALVLVSTLQVALVRRDAGLSTPWARLLADRAADWFTCGVFAAPFLTLVRRHLPDGWPGAARAARLAAGTLLLLAGATAAKVTMYAPLRRAADVPGRPAVGWAGLLRRQGLGDAVNFAAMLGLVAAAEFARRARDRAALAERLRAEAAEARLASLAGQLEPHFLFNALNTVSSLMHRDVERADRVLARLGDLLRRSLDARGRHEVPLAEELAAVDDYVAVMAERFDGRVDVRVDAPPGLSGALVPRLVLQPLVENALRHGVDRRTGVVLVAVRASRTAAGALELEVRDAGPGPEAPPATGGLGVGLALTRQRLATLYGDAQTLTLDAPPGGGARVRVTLPLRDGAAPRA